MKRCIGALVRTARDGIMIPKPQYPLYSAAITMVGGRAVYYSLAEEARGVGAGGRGRGVTGG